MLTPGLFTACLRLPAAVAGLAALLAPVHAQTATATATPPAAVAPAPAAVTADASWLVGAWRWDQQTFLADARFEADRNNPEAAARAVVLEVITLVFTPDGRFVVPAADTEQGAEGTYAVTKQPDGSFRVEMQQPGSPPGVGVVRFDSASRMVMSADGLINPWARVFDFEMRALGTWRLDAPALGALPWFTQLDDAERTALLRSWGQPESAASTPSAEAAFALVLNPDGSGTWTSGQSSVPIAASIDPANAFGSPDQAARSVWGAAAGEGPTVSLRGEGAAALRPTELRVTTPDKGLLALGGRMVPVTRQKPLWTTLLGRWVADENALRATPWFAALDAARQQSELENIVKAKHEFDRFTWNGGAYSVTSQSGNTLTLNRKGAEARWRVDSNERITFITPTGREFPLKRAAR